MPRPGPRPYECVRRAWHSDRHKPLRGSIIQLIFRLVGDAHSEKTKNNKEWQEQLPIVVMKCEEILYSKADSEHEYLDQGTLWDRVTDAVNTIIRLEVDETGKFLPPCVEAALTVGCVPVKASRSQRHCNTRTYLTPRPQPPNVVPHREEHNDAVYRQCPVSVPVSPSFANQDRQLVQNMGIASQPNPYTVAHKRLHSGVAPLSVNLDSKIPYTGGLVYPLYYGTDYQPEDNFVGINDRKRHCGYSQKILIGRPVTRLIPNPTIMGTSNAFVPKEIPKVDEQIMAPPCDLSLRLGVSPSSDADKEKTTIREANKCSLDLCLSSANSKQVGSIAESSVRNNQAGLHNFMGG